MSSSNDTKHPVEDEAMSTSAKTTEVGAVEDHVNASGHVQELKQNFSLLSACAVGIVTGNAWAALGGSVVLALYNGGAPGVIYELIVVSIFYWIIAAILAELASAIPSSAGVYHWAAVTGGPRWGKGLSWFAGWWNFFAWVFGAASMSSILANQVLTMYQLFHDDYAPHPWHVFISYVLITWICCATVLFGNRILPKLNDLMLFFILAGVFITIIVCAVMPSTTKLGYATNSAVWRDWSNATGWSNGFAFVWGMLNGAYSVGSVDCVSHIAEEIPHPRKNIPKAMATQMVTGLVTALFYIVAIFYSINDFDSVLSTTYLNPLGEVYRQATNSRAGSLGLLIVIFLPTFGTCIGVYITAGRMLYTLGRDNATPCSSWIGKINHKFESPFNATLVCGVICTILAAIQLGNSTAFGAFVGSFVVLSTASYLAAILPYLITRRKYVTPGPFRIPSVAAYPLMVIACLYIVAFIIIFCFPAAYPFDAATMNYASLIIGAISVFISAFWFWNSKRGYVSPTEKVMQSMAVDVMD